MIDFEFGQTQEAWTKIAKNEISLIFFYAPWDFDSQKFKRHYEYLSRRYHGQVSFIAINCWHPRGQCAALGEKSFPRYPHIHAVIKDIMVEYIGPLSIKYLNAFIQNILHPIQYLHDGTDFVDYRLKHDIVVLKKFKFDSSSYYPSGFKDFWKASLMALYRDPFRRAKFVVVTDDKLRDHRVRNISWDDASIIYTWNSSTTLISNQIDVIIDTAMANLMSKTLVPWFSPDGVKGDQLSRVLTGDPILILFTKRGFDLERSKDHIALKILAMYYRSCNTHTIDTLLKSVSEKAFIKLPAIKGDDFDINGLYCDSTGRSNSSDCANNTGLNFLAMDIYLCSSFASQLGLHDMNITDSQALIYNHKSESIYLNPYDNTVCGLSKFIRDWSSNQVKQYYKNSIVNDFNNTTLDGSTFSVQEISSENFSRVVEDKDSDIVVYYYAPWCIMCSAINHVFLEVAMKFSENERLKFVRINNHANDLPNQYSVDSYPTIVIFPSKRKKDSRKFLRSVINYQTLSKFITENTSE